jgi:hypothetical protein
VGRTDGSTPASYGERMPGFEEDLRAAVAADRELGAEYEAAVIRSLGERLDAEIDRRIEQRAARRRPAGGRGPDFFGLVLAVASIGMGMGVPSAMSGHFAGGLTFVMTLIAWAGIAAINIAYALGARRSSA